MNEREELAIQELKAEAIDLMSDWPASRNRQKSFVLAYMANGFQNATQAAKKAGFSDKSAGKNAHKMLNGTEKYVHIPPVVEKLKLAFDERQTELSILSNLEIEQFWADVVRGKIKDVKLVGVGEGEQVVKEVPADLSIRLNAADKAARSKGMYQTNIDITQRNIDIKVGDWDVDED
ncbi:terminase small subunit [Streptococcus hyovaginalis]|uniref:terminase small subunit n=1 Tax=Streptococcus hyovaginalis TaxID=149015 RepID=UPI001478BFC9|nr:terminase small subunit [Streptococcus hyovaginalis]